MNDTVAVAHGQMSETISQKQSGNSDSCGTCTIYHHPAVLFVLSCYFQGVDNACKDHDGCTMLVIMKYRDRQCLFQTFFYFKTTGGRDILQINAAEAGGYVGNRFDNLLRILGVQTDGNRVYAAKFLKKNRLSLHNRHGGIRADIAKAENGASI